jgi:hypothetical protein
MSSFFIRILLKYTEKQIHDNNGHAAIQRLEVSKVMKHNTPVSKFKVSDG